MSSLMEKAALSLYNIGWSIAGPFLSRNSRLAEGLEQRLLKSPFPRADLWIQGASVGESFLARSILNHLTPISRLKVLVTTNTSQGMDILTRNGREKSFCSNGLTASFAYFPFDKPSLMQKAVSQISPRVMVLLESELWPGLLDALKKVGAKILVVNGRINPESFNRYMLWRSFWKNRAPDRILAISKEDANRFSTLFGKGGVSVMSNIKFDRIGPASISSMGLERITKIIPKDSSFVALASIRREEELLVEKMMAKILSEKPEAIIGLFPRHMHRLEHWKRALNRMAVSWKLRSESDEQAKIGSVILWDIFGELAASYKMAKAAFVGGSLALLGGQNFLEPLICGVIPIIGPSWHNFYWVGREIMEGGLVKMAENWEEAAGMIIDSLQKNISRETVHNAAMKFIRRRQGGTEQAGRTINEMLA